MNPTKYSAVEIKLMSVRECEIESGIINDPQQSLNYWNEAIATSPWFTNDKEHLVVVCLNAKLKAVSHSIVSIGTLNETIAHPRDIFRPAIHLNAYAIVVMHNHPSGDSNPSAADYRITKRLKEAADLLQISLIDHFIVGDQGKYFSFKEAGIV